MLISSLLSYAYVASWFTKVSTLSESLEGFARTRSHNSLELALGVREFQRLPGAQFSDPGKIRCAMI
jgi:hypothetical protein